MPKVSIIVLNWNGKQFLKNCLDSLRKLTYKSVEIIIVDNNSTDGSQEFIKKYYPKFILVENKKNYGFARGNNIGFHKSKGKYVLFLNNDTVVSPSFLESLVDDLEKDSKIGCIQPQIRLTSEKDRLDQMGSYISFVGFLYHYGYRKKYSEKTYGKRREIFSAKGACIMFSSKLLKKIGLFDEDFFIFFEETDLCFRVWLSGYRVVYEPKSTIYHVVGGDTTASDKYKYERRIYLIFRNTNCSYLKNFDAVIWSTKTDLVNINDEDADALADYYNKKGRLIVEGSDVAFKHNKDNFMREVLHAELKSDIGFSLTSAEELNNLSITLARAHPLLQNLQSQLQFNSTIDPFPDSVQPYNESAEIASWYSSTDGSAMIAYEDWQKRTLFLPFSIAALDEAAKNIFTNSSINWLLENISLDIKPIRLEHGMLFEGEVNKTIVIHSTEQIPNDINIQIFVDGSKIVERTITAEMFSLNEYYYPYATNLNVGKHIVKVIVNSGFSVKESNYVNNLREYNLTVENFQKAIKINPKNINLVNNLGIVYLLSGNKDKAKEIFNFILSSNPNNQTALAGLAESNK